MTPSSTADSQTARPPTQETVIVLLLFILAAACYANTLAHGFVYDDEIQILQNPYVKSWHYLPQIFGTTVWSFVGDAGATNYYRPLMTLTFLIQWKIYDGSPVGFHLLNVALNALVTACVFYAGRALFKDLRVAVLSAVLFAVHPIHTETVNWIAAVPDLEMTFLFLLAFFLYVAQAADSVRARIIVALLFLLALLAKEPALMLAPLTLLYEHFVRDDRFQTTYWGKAKRYMPVCVAAGGYLAVRIALFGKLAPVLQHAQISWHDAIVSGFALVAQYAKLLLVATPLSAFHVFHVSQSLGGTSVILGITIVASCVAFILAAYRRWPGAAFCVAWIGFTLAPVLNARWMAANVLTERYLYLPSVAYCWLVAFVLTTLRDRFHLPNPVTRVCRIAFAILFVVIICAGLTRTWKRNRVWQNDSALYTETLKTDPDSYVMRMNLGVSYLEVRDFAAAEKQLDYALGLKPDSANVLNALGCLYLDQGRIPDAAATFQKAIALRPDWSDPHFNYGRALEKLDRKTEALGEFRTAIRVGPLNATAHLSLADALKERRDDHGAEAEYRRSLELQPRLRAQRELANLLIKTGRDNDAEQVLRAILKEYPIDSESHLSLGRLLEKRGRVDEARRQYEATLQADPGNTEARNKLANLQSH